MASVRKRTWVYKGVERSAWVVTCTDRRGKRPQKTFKTKKAADAYKKQVEAEIDRGIYTADSASVTVRVAGEHWLEVCERRHRVGDRMMKTTIINYRLFFERYILPYLGEKKLSQLTVPVVQEWVDSLVYHKTKPRKPPSVNRAIVCLGLILTEAQRERWIGCNVVKEVPPRRPRAQKDQKPIPSKKDVKTILNESSGRIHMIIHMAVFTGMRISEILGLTWEHVDFQTGTIHVFQRADKWGKIDMPKSRAGNRYIAIAPGLKVMLKEWYLGCPKGEKNPQGFVFPTKLGVAEGPNNFAWNRWRPFMNEVGLAAAHAGGARRGGQPNFRFHDLRHVAASLLIEQGLPAKQIQRIMGHATIAMTFDTYGHLFDEGDSRSAIDAIEQDILT